MSMSRASARDVTAAASGDRVEDVLRRLERRRWWVLTLTLLFFVLGSVAAYRAGPRRLLVVEEGVLYRSAGLPAAQLGRVVDELGIRTVVNLRSQNEMDRGGWHAEEVAVLEERGVELVDIPLYTGWPPKSVQITEWIDLATDPERQPVLVHCEYGIVRTGMMVALYEMEVRGRSNAEAWAKGFEVFDHEIREPVHSRVHAYVQEYVRANAQDHADDTGEGRSGR